ncbi:MAG: DUF5615 family PIN-like protein [Planctomycetota bacterium]
MARTIRFHVDEHVTRVIAEGLRRRGMDVTTTVGVGLCSATDEEQLAFARSDQRVLVTFDAGFLRLHASGVEHTGIIFLSPRRGTVRELLRLLLIVYEQLSAEDMANHVEFL